MVVRPGLWVRNKKAENVLQPLNGWGTIGFIVHAGAPTGSAFLVTNSHVLAPDNLAPAKGNAVVVAEKREGESVGVGTLYDWTRFKSGVLSTVDLALVEIKSTISISARDEILGGPTGYSRHTAPPMPVFTRGANDIQIRPGSIVKELGSDVVELVTAQGETEKYPFTDLVYFEGSTDGGDSGSAVVNRWGRIVGLHIGLLTYDDSYMRRWVSYFCRIDNVLNAISEMLGEEAVLKTEPADSDLHSPTVGAANRRGRLFPGRDSRPNSHLPSENAPVSSARKAEEESAIDTLARTLWGEARGEWADPKVGADGYCAVAEVVLNRAIRRTGNETPPPAAIERECRRPCQFSCWNDGMNAHCPHRDPNLSRLLSVGNDNSAFRAAREIATDFILNRKVTNLTLGSRHYYNPDAVRGTPSWARSKLPAARIGRHIFFNNID